MGHFFPGLQFKQRSEVPDALLLPLSDYEIVVFSVFSFHTAGHPKFYRFRALGSPQFFSEHSLGFQSGVTQQITEEN